MVALLRETRRENWLLCKENFTETTALDPYLHIYIQKFSIESCLFVVVVVHHAEWVVVFGRNALLLFLLGCGAG